VPKFRNTHQYLSQRELPLVYWSDPIEGRTILTVENYCKWYGFDLVHSDGRVERIGFGELEKFSGDEIPCSDHVPNPKAVKAMCEAKDWFLDTQAEEMMIGRWEIEVKRTYGNEK
jgi:hypothetical protein